MRTPSPDEARDRLDEAGRLGAAARSGASWPQVALLLGLGGVSSMFMVAMTFVVRVDERFVFLPMVLMLVWIGILSLVMLVFTRATKVGFGRRWRRAMRAWGLTWVVAIIGGTVWWQGEIWFAVAAAVALTLVTVIPAWNEARR